MITLNTEKGLVKIESWEDVVSRPGFTVDIDPQTVKLKAIIGNYLFSAHHPCGLKSCRTPHGKGYLVVAENGTETNIGHICGKTFFGVDFVRMRRAYEADVRAKERRERLTKARHCLPAWREQIEGMKSGAHGATWIQKMLGKLAALGRFAPRTVGYQLSRIAKQRDGTIAKARLATMAERELLLGQGQKAERPHYIVEKVGQLDGAAALYSENDLRKLLVEPMAPLDQLEVADFDNLSDYNLRELDKKISQVEPSLEQAANAIAAGQRLLTRGNLGQLELLVDTRAEHEAVKAFLQQLP